MEELRSRIRTNIIYGAIALLPVAALVYILIKLFGLLETLAEPLSPYLGTTYPLLKTVLLLALALSTLLILCYLFGLLINTQIGALSFEKLESRLRDNIPGYQIIANLLRGIVEHKMSYICSGAAPQFIRRRKFRSCEG